MRLEVFSRPASSDPRIRSVRNALRTDFNIKRVLVGDVYLWAGWEKLDLKDASMVFADPVAQQAFTVPSADVLLPDWSFALEIAFKQGVTDPVALTAKEALEIKAGSDPDGRISPSVFYLFEADPVPGRDEIENLAQSFYNPLIQEVRVYLNAGSTTSWQLEPPAARHFEKPQLEIIPVTGLTDTQLETLSSQRLLALELAEMKAIQGYYLNAEVQALRKERGLGVEPTDVELEMLAQTWSEHCKHKIFQAEIEYHEPATGERKNIQSLFKTYIKATTDALTPQKKFLRSVFTDNSGVIAMDDETLVCFKVETHNSPSALDPYGGAITGIVGVNRDILGTGIGAKPIWNTNVLCFGPPDTPADKVPKGLLPPERVLSGVHKGIVDGGNHSGIPTAAGAFLFDESYLGKPLVFCGTGGLLPSKVRGRNSWEKRVNPGSYAVMAGGRIGKDGIHGATFSSLALEESSPTSAVQIGDPIIQKIMADFLLEARDLGLYEALTDNGAGGLSSSLGEMAQDSGGVRVQLDACPLKYPGLAAWEIWVSESQERMSFSVPPEKWKDFSALAQKRGVEVTIVGTFNDSGLIELRDGENLVGLMHMEFLHDGLPRMRLKAEWREPLTQRIPLGSIDIKKVLTGILCDPNVGSKESLIRQYDHEVQGRSLIKPFTGLRADAPTDGGALRLKPGNDYGVSVTHGVCPRVGDTDALAMAACAVDEAFRAHIALGGDPEHAAVLDNFCWPDPVESAKTPDGKYKLAQLVRACEGLKETCLAYGLPLISGKDSMKNDAWSEGRKISVRPTLLVSLVGKIPNAEMAPDTDFLSAGARLYIVGKTSGDFAGSMAEKVLGMPLSGVPMPDTQQAMELYRRMHLSIKDGLFESVHDLSDGGLAVALVESCLGGRLGAGVDITEAAQNQNLSPEEVLFSESPARFLVSVAPGKVKELEDAFNGLPLYPVGCTLVEEKISFSFQDKVLSEITLEEAEHSWKYWSRKWA